MLAPPLRFVTVIGLDTDGETELLFALFLDEPDSGDNLNLSSVAFDNSAVKLCFSLVCDLVY